MLFGRGSPKRHASYRLLVCDATPFDAVVIFS